MLVVSILKTVHLDVTPSTQPAASNPMLSHFLSRKGTCSDEGPLTRNGTPHQGIVQRISVPIKQI